MTETGTPTPMDADTECLASSRRSEDGDTLIEVLLAIVVLGVAAVAILMAFATSILGSSQHRTQVTLDTVLRSAAESATTQVQQQSSQWCSAGVVFPAPQGYALPSGYTAQVTTTYWNGTGFSSQCTTTAPQKLTIAVTYSGTTSTISTVVDDPLAQPLPASGAAAKLVFSVSPSSTSTAGAPFAVQPVVTVEDQNGNQATSDLSGVTLAIESGTGTSGASLSSCPGTEYYGMVTFSNCSISLVGSGYTLVATLNGSNGTVVAYSSPFSIVAGAPSQLVFSTSPGNATSSVAFNPQPVVSVEDALGNVVTTDSSTVTLAITSGTGTSGATLSSCVGSETSGVVTFSGCNIATAGTNYTLTATDGTLSSATSSFFNVVAAVPTKFVFTSSPVSGTASSSATLGPITVQEQTSTGNPATTAETVHLSSSSTGAKFSATSGGSTITSISIPAGSSSATFYYADTAAGTPTLSASGSLTSATQSETINPGSASKLAFNPTSPGPGIAGNAIPSISVLVEDGLGNPVPSASSGSVTMTLKSGSPETSFDSGTVTVGISNGVATFSNLVLNISGSYTLTASPSGISGVTSSINSSAFTVSAAAMSGFSVANPGTQTAGSSFTDTITAVDAYGNTVTTYTGSQTTIAFSGPSNSPNATAPTYPTSVTFSSGVGTATLTLVDAQSTTIVATQGSFLGSSTNFTVSSASANVLAFTTQPSGATAINTNFPIQPVVTVEDNYGNAASSSKAVTLSTGSGTGSLGGSSSCTSSVTPSNGVATFSGCQWTSVGAGDTIQAKSPSFTTIVSKTFNITTAATKVVFTTQPSTAATAGTVFATQPVVSVEDASNRVVTADSTSTVALAMSANPGNGTLTCASSLSLKVSYGVASFSGCSINKSSTTAATLKATDGGVTTATSTGVVVSAGTATQLVFTTQPNSGNHNVAFTTQPVVTIEDALGNTVTSNTSSVTLTIGTNPGNGTLSCTVNPRSAASGVATFAGCKISTAGTGYTLNATDGSLTAATSNAFNES